MSVSKMAKRRGAILHDIMRHHRERLPKVMRDVPEADLRAISSVAAAPKDFYAALKRPGISMIAECKKASPSKGLMVPDYDPVALALDYVQAGARAISVLTDSRHFQGKLEDLRDVKEAFSEQGGRSSKTPVLRKDFIFHPYQVYETRAAGADAILLIMAVLEGNEPMELLALTRTLGMEALIEVHTEPELERALLLGPRVIGINNRDLRTFEVNFETTGRLRSQIPDQVVVVAESGIKTAADVSHLRELGLDAILVGQSLVRSKNVQAKVRELVKAGRLDND